MVVTGLGAVTPLGRTAKDFWKGLVDGVSGIGPMTLCDTTDYPTKIAGEIPDFDPKEKLDAREARRMARFSQIAVSASLMAVEDAGLDLGSEDPTRLGIVLGNGCGGFPDIEAGGRTIETKGGMRLSPFFFPMILPNMATSQVSRMLGLKGFTNTVTTSCAAGTQGVGDALEVIRRGAADVMVSGGTEAGISQLGLGGFSVMKALSTNNDDPSKASRPFDANRDGFVPAEGAGILLLETLEHALARDADILCEVTGYGVSSDAFHMVQPDDEGAGAARAMTWALADANVNSWPDRLRERSRNLYAAQRCHRDSGHQAGVWRVGLQRGHKLDEVDDRARVGWGGGHGKRGLRDDDCGRGDAPNHQLRAPRPRLRPGLRPQRGAQAAGREGAVKQLSASAAKTPAWYSRPTRGRGSAPGPFRVIALPSRVIPSPSRNLADCQRSRASRQREVAFRQSRGLIRPAHPPSV